jgi:hypothetical protein
MEDRPSLIVRAEDWPHGLTCADCHKELTDGESYSHRLSAFVGDVPLSYAVCVPCAMRLAD